MVLKFHTELGIKLIIGYSIYIKLFSNSLDFGYTIIEEQIVPIVLVGKLQALVEFELQNI